MAIAPAIHFSSSSWSTPVAGLKWSVSLFAPGEGTEVGSTGRAPRLASAWSSLNLRWSARERATSERSEETIAREIMEELGAEINGLHYLATLENIFTYQDQKGHEIVLVYDGAFVDKRLYQQQVVYGLEGAETIKAVWIETAARGPESPPLYPDGLPELLARL